MVCLLIAGAIYWHNRRFISSHYLGLSALVLAVFSILMPHGNAAYMIFAYPFFVAMLLTAFRADRRPWIIVGCTLLLTVPQQIYLIHLTWHLGYRSSDVAKVTQAIGMAAHQLNLQEDTLRIYGDYRLWFAHPHLYEAAAPSTSPDIRKADLYICYNSSPQPASLEPSHIFYCPTLKAMVPLRLMETLSLRNEQLFIYAKK